MATHIEYTPSSSPSGIQQTISFWMKRCEIGTSQCIFESRQNGTNLSTVKFNTNDELQIYSENGGTTNVYVKTNRRFRDVNGWYHIVYAIDTSQGTASNRIKLYVNGVQETSFSTSTYPSSSYDNFWFGIAQKQVIGRDNQGGGSEDFQGLLTHFHYSRGYVYQASTFGSTDSKNGEWKINTSPSGVNYGSTGWFVLKDGNSVTDQSGNGNNFTVGSGTLTKTEDCPSNVFCTINPLDYSPNPATLLSGNTRYNKTGTGSGHNASMSGTLGAMTGKWYFEAKVKDSSSFIIGMVRTNHVLPNGEGYYGTDAGVYGITNGGKQVGGSGGSQSVSYSANDIFGFAFDLDNGKFYVHVNGTYLNSGDPTSGSTGTGKVDDISVGSRIYVPFVTNANYGDTNDIEFNFGNGYFGTTAVSSAGTNASNNGIFEYNVPAGYTALSTKGLNL